MKPDGVEGSGIFEALLKKADHTEVVSALRRLGRHVLARQPLVLGLESPQQDDQQYLSSMEQHPWVDFQLLDSSPEQRLLDSADFEKYDLLLEAWPDGFDKVIFSFGDDDEQHAEAIVDTLLRQADEDSIPIKAEADCTDEEFERALQREFVVFIRQWRVRTIEMMT